MKAESATLAEIAATHDGSTHILTIPNTSGNREFLDSLGLTWWIKYGDRIEVSGDSDARRVLFSPRYRRGALKLTRLGNVYTCEKLPGVQIPAYVFRGIFGEENRTLYLHQARHPLPVSDAERDSLRSRLARRFADRACGTPPR